MPRSDAFLDPDPPKDPKIEPPNNPLGSNGFTLRGVHFLDPLGAWRGFGCQEVKKKQASGILFEGDQEKKVMGLGFRV